LTPQQVAVIDESYRRRAQDVLSIDRLIGSIEAALRRSGADGHTVIVFSSDNGYHMGQYRLMPGKMTAFDTDVQVPLVVTGPGIPAGRTDAALVQNVDLGPTFRSLAGLGADGRMDGTTLTGSLHGRHRRTTLTAALVEHRGPDRNPADPDYAGPAGGNPPSYEAIRTRTYTYVRYLSGGAEYYDRRRDPSQLHNLYSGLSARRRAALRQSLLDLSRCRGTAACTAARSG
jgi:arylsulfatase A-like enzyme